MTRLPIDLDQLAIALESRDPGLEWVLDRETGEIIPVTDAPSEEEEELEEGGDRCIRIEPIPSSEGFRLMADFASSVPDRTIRRRLEAALRSPKPFRRFQEALEEWPDRREARFAFHDRALAACARRWLEDEGIEAELPTGPRQAP